MANYSPMNRVPAVSSMFKSLIVLILGAGVNAVLSPAYTRVKEVQPVWEEMVPSLTIPPILDSRLTPLDASATASIISTLKFGAGLGNVSAFCKKAGLLCDEAIDEFSVLLYSLGPYQMPPASSNHSDRSQHMNLDLFFGQRKLVSGNRISLSKHLIRHRLPGRAFLPRALEKELPFSSQTLPQLLTFFNFTRSSNLARNMAETLKVCEATAMEGETKACVSSLESMVDFATSVIGTGDLEILAGSAEIERLNPEQSTTVTVKSVMEMKAARKGAVACHNAMFPYQVFYCHQLRGSRIFKVELQTDEGASVLQAVASCHLELKLRSFSKQLFAKLKVSRGELICHWSTGDNVVWIPATRPHVAAMVMAVD